MPCMLINLCPNILTEEYEFKRMIYLSKKIILW